MTVWWGGDGLVELTEPGLQRGIAAREARDRRPRFSASAVVAIVQAALAAEGVDFQVTDDRMNDLIRAAAGLLSAGCVYPDR